MFPRRNNRNSTSPFARRYFLATVATRPTPSRDILSSQKQSQLDLNLNSTSPLREKIFPRNSCNSTSPLREKIFPRKNNRNLTSPCRNNRNSTSPFARHSFLTTVATCPPLATFVEKVSGTKVVC